MLFTKENRVHLQRDFDFLKKNAKKADCSAFVFYCLPRCENKKSRIGLITSKRVGCAVERNTARRRFRAIFREVSPTFKMQCDILVFVRRSYSKFSYEKLSEKFSKAANQIIENAIRKEKA